MCCYLYLPLALPFKTQVRSKTAYQYDSGKKKTTKCQSTSVTCSAQNFLIKYTIFCTKETYSWNLKYAFFHGSSAGDNNQEFKISRLGSLLIHSHSNWVCNHSTGHSSFCISLTNTRKALSSQPADRASGSSFHLFLQMPRFLLHF